MIPLPRWAATKRSLTRITSHSATAYVLIVIVMFVSLAAYQHQGQVSDYKQCKSTYEARTAVRGIVVYITRPTVSNSGDTEKALLEFPSALRVPIANLLKTFTAQGRTNNEGFREFALRHLPLPDCQKVKPSWSPW